MIIALHQGSLTMNVETLLTLHELYWSVKWKLFQQDLIISMFLSYILETQPYV